MAPLACSTITLSTCKLPEQIFQSYSGELRVEGCVRSGASPIANHCTRSRSQPLYGGDDDTNATTVIGTPPQADRLALTNPWQFAHTRHTDSRTSG